MRLRDSDHGGLRTYYLVVHSKVKWPVSRSFLPSLQLPGGAGATWCQAGLSTDSFSPFHGYLPRPHPQLLGQVGMATWQSFLQCAVSHQNLQVASFSSGWMLMTKKTLRQTVRPKDGRHLHPQVNLWKNAARPPESQPQAMGWGATTHLVWDPGGQPTHPVISSNLLSPQCHVPSYLFYYTYEKNSWASICFKMPNSFCSPLS